MEGQSVDGYVLVIGSAGMMGLISMFILFIFLYQKKVTRKQRAYAEIEKMLHKQELMSAYTLIEAREAERKRIAEDVHDNLGSLLATLCMYSDLLNRKEVDEQHDYLAKKVATLAEQTYSETRRISHNLDSGIRSFGLKPAIENLMNAVRDSRKLDAVCVLDLTEDMSGELSQNIYRIIQELVNNTLKHAQATLIRIEITQIDGEYVSIIFEDNGRGFRKDQVASGIGLRNIDARVSRFKGSINISSVPGRGTTCIVEMPLA